VKARLAEAGQHLHKFMPGRLTRPETIHLTLVFIGDLVRDRIPELIERLNRIEAPSFRVDFDRADCWHHNHIVYLAPSQPPEALFSLVMQLESALDELAIPFDRRPYKPHVTLIRKAECPKANPAGGRVSDSPEWGDIRPIMWSAERFVLVESVSIPVGVRYDKLGSFGLL
ncbi:MAG: RNA 2',3'-cyclic phosphodiesterase, partial [Hydrogenophilaceae bacterium]